MHLYSTDSKERFNVFIFLAGISILTAWGVHKIFFLLEVSLPWWIEAPSVFGYCSIYFGIFDKWLWKIQILTSIGIIRLPNLNGSWQGTISSSFDNHDTQHEGNIEITQTWTHIRISLRTQNSQSVSLSAMIIVAQPVEKVLSYEYLNEPFSHADSEMQIHRGTARLSLSLINESPILEGEYYSGRGRQQFGNLRFSLLNA